MNVCFHHERLPVYQQALEFAKWADSILDRTPKNSAAYAQLDQGKTLLLMKIAAARGQVSSGHQAHLLDAAQTAALESAACLDLLFNKRILSKEEVQRGKETLRQIASALGEPIPAPHQITREKSECPPESALKHD